MDKAEILAPAGSMKVLDAALQAGADAVYLGLRYFNARSGARNFTPGELRDAVERMHSKGGKVYVTLNTLLTQLELGMAARSLILARQCGVDGVLITDPAYLCFKEFVPDIPFHFSTQAGVSSSAGVKAAKKLGVSRVVLARELDFDEIKAASAVEGVETEVFVQGALCFSCSGRCLLSSWGGGRSGNRGNCASPCRVLWKNREGVEARPMSMRDLCLLEWLGSLEHIGVASLKIEGRLKSPEWVAKAVALYRNAIDNSRPVEELREEARRLGDYTGRDLTDGYLRAAREGMTGDSGRLACGCAAEDETANQTVFCVSIEEEGQGGYIWTFSCGDKSATFRTPPQRVPNPRRATTLSNAYKNIQAFCMEKKLPLAPLERFDYFQTKLLSRNAANSVADAFIAFARSLEKEDDCLPRGIQLPLELKNAIAGGRCAANNRSFGGEPDRVRCYFSQIDSLPNSVASLEKIAVIRDDDLKNMEALFAKLSQVSVVAFPQVVYEGQLEALKKVAEECAKRNIAVEVNSWDTWNVAKNAGCIIEAGQGLAVMNSLAARQLEKYGCRCVCVSCELDKTQMEELSAAAQTPLSILVYGRPALMTTRAKLPSLFAKELEDARGIALSCEQDGTLTVIRPVAPLDLRHMKNPKIKAAHLVVDVCGGFGVGKGSTFNYGRHLK